MLQYLAPHSLVLDRHHPNIIHTAVWGALLRPTTQAPDSAQPYKCSSALFNIHLLPCVIIGTIIQFYFNLKSLSSDSGD